MARSSPNSEHANQVAYFDWALLHPLARRAFAIPNGGFRKVQTAVALKAEGVRAGVLDICLPLARGGAHGLWIEMKAGNNKMTAGQVEEAGQLVKDGYAVAVCWRVDEAITITQQYLAGDIGPAFFVLKAPK